MSISSKLSMSGSGIFVIGSGNNFRRSEIIFQVVIPSAWSGSLTPKKKLQGAPSSSYNVCAYTSFSNDLSTTAIITGSGIFRIDATEADVAVDNTNVSGQVDIYSIVANS